jgi:hypothetical protein
MAKKGLPSEFRTTLSVRASVAASPVRAWAMSPISGARVSGLDGRHLRGQVLQVQRDDALLGRLCGRGFQRLKVHEERGQVRPPERTGPLAQVLPAGHGPACRAAVLRHQRAAIGHDPGLDGVRLGLEQVDPALRHGVGGFGAVRRGQVHLAGQHRPRDIGDDIARGIAALRALGVHREIRPQFPAGGAPHPRGDLVGIAHAVIPGRAAAGDEPAHRLVEPQGGGDVASDGPTRLSGHGGQASGRWVTKTTSLLLDDGW